MLDRLEDIRKRSIRYAPSFQQDPFDIFARERVPLNRVRSRCVERPGASPHARRECVQWSSGEQFVPELGQYGLQHVLVIYHTSYLRIYGHTTSQSNIPYHLDVQRTEARVTASGRVVSSATKRRIRPRVPPRFGARRLCGIPRAPRGANPPWRGARKDRTAPRPVFLSGIPHVFLPPPPSSRLECRPSRSEGSRSPSTATGF